MIGSLAEGRFKALKKLAPRGAATLFLVEDLEDKRARRVLELLEPIRETGGERRLAHFERELEALAALQHPNLQKILGHGATEADLPGIEGRYLYVVGELLDGPDFHRFASRASWSLFVEVTVQVLRGIEFLHGQGLLHGALTPERIVVTGRGPRKTAKLLDYGLAPKGLLDALSQPRFLAPEVLEGAPADRRADLYSLGAILYEAATRHPIAEGTTKEAVLKAKPPRAPRELKKTIPKPVEELILSLVARDPAARPPSANAMIRDLNKSGNKRFSVETHKDAKAATILTPRFLGRDDELADLEGICARALLGPTAENENDDPSLVVISGEAGLGKSRLVRELRARFHGKNVAFVEARAADGGSPPALDLVLRALAAVSGPGEEPADNLIQLAAPLARLIPELPIEAPTPLAPEDERHRVTDAAARTLLACGRKKPLVLVLEDAHDADALSLDVLRLVAHDLRSARTRREGGLGDDAPEALEDGALVVIATLSHEELPGKPIERLVRDLLAQEGVRELTLERLPQEVLEAVVASALGRDLAQVRPLAERVAREADGNLAVAEEALAALADDGKLPPPDGAFKLDQAAVDGLELGDGLMELAKTRLAKLPDDARALVHALALSPAPRDVRSLAEALELDEAEVLALAHELERRRLAPAPIPGADEDQPARLVLENAALRDAALADLGPEEVEAIDDALGRALARRAVALEAEESTGNAYAIAEEAARHLLKGTRRSSGAPFALACAMRLADAAAFERAAELLGLALGALEEAVRRGELEKDEALDAAHAIDDVPAPPFVEKLAVSDVELALLLARGEALLRTGRPQDARGDFERGLGLARTRRRPREAVTAILGAGRAATALGDLQKARARFEEAAALAREVDWPRGLALALREQGVAHLEAGDLEEAVSILENVAKIEEERQDKVALAAVLRDLARALEARGDTEAAIERAARSRDLDEESERPSGVSASYLLLAQLHQLEEKNDRALELARRAVELAREARDPRGIANALGAVAHILKARGENEEAIARFEAALELLTRAADPVGTASVRHDLGILLAARGRFDEAQGHLEGAVKLFSQQKRRRQAALATITLAEMHLVRGDVTRARDAVERATQEGEPPAADGSPGPSLGIGRVALEATRVKAEIAFRQGDLARAEDLARSAAENAARTAHKAIEASSRITLGSAILRRGRPQEAEKELREAMGLARALGDGSLEARARLALVEVHVARADPHGALAEVEAARDAAQRLGEVGLEVRSLLAWARLHTFLGQARRAESILEQARTRAEQLGLGLVRPEITLAWIEASQEARAAEALPGPDGVMPVALPGGGSTAASQARAEAVKAQKKELAATDGLLEEADRDARATSRRSLHAEVDLARGQEELLRGNATGARERAEAALEAARIAEDAILTARAELLIAESRLASGRPDEARAAAERALAVAEQSNLVESRARALLVRARSLDAQDAPRAAAKDLREAASTVRAAWAALPEELRESYGKKTLARAIAQTSHQILARAATVPAPAAPAAPAPAAPKPAAPAGAGAPPREDTAEASGVAAAVQLDTLKDPLTGLYNHTYFTAHLEIEIKRSHRHSRPLSLIKINIDRFKLVRELYGPRTGKRIIREVAAVLVRNLRDVDVVARYFGDEFEALLPDTDAYGAILTCDRLRAAAESTAFAHEGEKIDLTISVGATTYPTDAKDKDSLICRVDEALYNARTSGPNKTFAFSNPNPEKETEPDKELRELDSLLLSREGRLILSMVQRVVSSELDLDKLIALTTGMVVEATRGERGFFMLKGRDGELVFKHGRNIDDKEILSPELKISHGIAREVARTGEPILVEEALDDGRFREFKSVMDLKLRSILCAPIKTAPKDGSTPEVLGIMYVDHNSISRHFTKEDLNFLAAIAQRVSIPIKNSKTLAETEQQLEELKGKLKTSQDQLETKYRYDKIIGATEPMQKIYKLLDRIVETHHSVVIHGESGTGKELIARAIHYNGPRKNKPFVAENCAALTDTLLEAELFGHVKGAFTGADKDSKGLFELANGGTLFLDEIGDMSERMQKKLLRVLQEGEVRPVGGKRILKVDVRIISASNKDLKKLVQERKFREDLYYRLNVITVNLPSLRERRDDIALLVEHFLKRICGDVVKTVDRETMRLLSAYDWPGNVRELENEINRMVAMSDESITAAALSPKIREGSRPEVAKDDGLGKYYDRPLKEVEFEVMKDIILKTLERTNWHRTKAAKILKVPTSTLFNKMKKYGIG
jgi:Nif-specific regulatory protein